MSLANLDTVNNGLGGSKKRGILRMTANLEDMMVTRNLKNNSTGPEPFVAKGVPKILEKGPDDNWLSEKAEDIERVTKYIFSSKGLLWEAHMAGLQTVQNGLDDRRFNNVNSRGGLKQLLLNVGKSLVTDIGLTAGTLEQVAGNGTGFRNETYLNRAYLVDGAKNNNILRQLLAQTGIVRNGNVSGAQRVRSGGSVNVKGEESIAFSLLENIVDEKLAFRQGEYSHVPGEQFNLQVTAATTATTDRKPDSTNYKYEKDLLENEGWTHRILSGSSDLFYHSLDDGGVIKPQAFLEGAETQFTNPGRRTTYLKNTVRQRTQTADSYRQGTHNKSTNTEWDVQNDYYSLNGDSDDGPTGKTYVHRVKNDIQNIHRSPDNVEGFQQAWKGREQLTNHSNLVKNGKKLAQLDLNSGYTLHQYSGFGNVSAVNDIKAPRKDVDAAGIDSEDFTWQHPRSDDTYFAFNQIPFEISTITPDKRIYLDFEANLDSYSDNYTGAWDEVQYVGRADKFFVYNGFTREINFAFKVAAKNQEELLPIYKRLNALVAVTAPTYAADALFMRGTIASVTIGDVLRSQVGIVKSVNLTWQTDYLWETDREILRVPQLLDVSVSFTPLHDFNVKTDISLNENGDELYFGKRWKAKASGGTTRTTEAGNTPLCVDEVAVRDALKRDTESVAMDMVNSIFDSNAMLSIGTSGREFTQATETGGIAEKKSKLKAALNTLWNGSIDTTVESAASQARGLLSNLKDPLKSFRGELQAQDEKLGNIVVKRRR